MIRWIRSLRQARRRPLRARPFKTRLNLESLEDRCLLSSFVNTGFLQTNLVSDIAGVAPAGDTNLVNAWGMASSPTGPMWVADNHTGVSTLYANSGEPPAATTQSLVVTIPSPTGGTPPAAPTGIVFNSTTDFQVSSGTAGPAPAIFIFDTEDGTVSGWNPTVGAKNAILEVDNSASGAVYKGLALSNNADGNFLFATNFNSGKIDIFDKNFKPATTFAANAFTDASIPANFAPFGIANIGGKLYVTYAMQDAAKHDDVAGPGNGFIDVYDTNGTLLQRLVSNGVLNSPWGLALAPANFGPFGSELLVGNFGDGRINAFDPSSGASLGAVTDAQNNPISITGLWGLRFGNGGAAGDPKTLFFTAGIGSPTKESNGLFGVLEANANLLSGSPNQRFVEQVYFDLLNRPVDVTGLNQWAGMLDQGTSRQTVVEDIETSQEYRTDVVQNLYQKLLHRAADSGGLANWLNTLNGGGTAEQVQAGIIGSDEYFNTRGGGTVSGFLDALYQDVLNRTIDSAGSQTWTQAINNGTPRTTVATDILASLESDQDEVNAIFTQFLGRTADSSGLSTFTAQLQGGLANEIVIAEVIASQEFFNNVS